MWRNDTARADRSAVASTEVERHTGVHTAEVPSAAWGWSGSAPRLWHVIGVVVSGFLLLMVIGNHVGHVEDWTLIAFAVVILVITGRDWRLRRRGWIR
jgi:hypothetical protein